MPRLEAVDGAVPSVVKYVAATPEATSDGVSVTVFAVLNQPAPIEAVSSVVAGGVVSILTCTVAAGNVSLPATSGAVKEISWTPSFEWSVGAGTTTSPVAPAIVCPAPESTRYVMRATPVGGAGSVAESVTVTAEPCQAASAPEEGTGGGAVAATDGAGARGGAAAG